MMQENNLLNRNSTNDIQRGHVDLPAQVILISSVETENQLSYCGSTLTAQDYKMVITTVCVQIDKRFSNT